MRAEIGPSGSANQLDPPIVGPGLTARRRHYPKGPRVARLAPQPPVTVNVLVWLVLLPRASVAVTVSV
jgi:hypothetical protein